MADSDKSEKNLSILVVDDDEPVRETMTWMLEDAGHDVHSAADATEALSFLGRHDRVNLVISDINMPGINGVELARQAKRRWPHIPVILVSGRPPPIGADPFISKPFDWRTLSRVIASLACNDDWKEQASAD